MFSAATGKEEFTLNNKKQTGNDGGEGEGLDELTKLMKAPNFPCTQVRWRPAGSESKTKNVLISVNAESDGYEKCLGLGE